ncbi:hypothetical protein CAPTEDRAFT_219688 [Capitella teleta]|uniref:C2H2-type domain-containing protein n=1 Tax=Capitella teleta TaxID=283909 RepID=R7UCX3_CAPTE|nr:hypothetical protein CAPTEDRAFT_219688 [Capitella teleta]|eukprot:ELU01112.1 hypothetical protein CAPTEDRAFT_219688 [Capitella teleta]
MPKGFLVKRHKPLNLSTFRRRGSEEDPSDSERSASGSEHEDQHTSSSAPKILCPLLPTDNAQYSCSPDSGYANSPGSILPIKDDNENLAPRRNLDKCDISPGSGASHSRTSSPSFSPLSVHTPASFPHGFQFSAFDRLRVCSPQHRIGPAGPLFPGLHLLPHAAFHSGNYFPPPLNGNFGLPPSSLHAPLLMPAPHSPFKAASRILSPVNPSQGSRPSPLLSNAYSMSTSPGKKRTASESISSADMLNANSKPMKSAKKTKAQRKIHFDEDNSSPVSGTIIRDAPNEQNGFKVCSGDIDSSLNLVEVTPEARAELEKIDNKIGDYICQLCRDKFEDAFQLAQHKCSRIVHVEYRCPECDKVFNCPANLASHRRWHKPRPNGSTAQSKNPAAPKRAPSSPLSKPTDVVNGNYGMFMHEGDARGGSPGGSSSGSSDQGTDAPFECQACHRRFKREAYLRKHEATHHAPMHSPQSITERYSCHYCGESLKTEVARTKHILQMHTPGLGGLHQISRPAMPPMLPRSPEQVYRPEQAMHCKFCPSVFFSSPGLHRHISKCHSSESRQVMSYFFLPFFFIRVALHSGIL